MSCETLDLILFVCYNFAELLYKFTCRVDKTFFFWFTFLFVKCALNYVISSLNYVISSLNCVISSLNYVISSLNCVISSLNYVISSLIYFKFT